MLKLDKITKTYVVADTKVEALKGITISFRKNEFVSILGPSGCGKTTLLNIIGGLDHYTSGDLFINRVSTKEYTDRDFDTYRNHKIGFIFQSYNLIPHQTILENVELALTIGGVTKEERIEKAKKALDKVGLEGQYHKRPNQLSGGQCQRVAIARALVNEPDILLADEPTGALDTVTSVQIMELIKEISNDRLVIMVTHNPELAEKYSTRTIRLLDGEVISDSNPYYENELQVVENENEKKSKLSFWTAFKLSARNLKSKFKRTLMVCIAGSIGIIGVATVLAVSNGVTNYISSMQTDMLSGNPITINEEAMNLSAIIGSTSSQTQKEGLKYALNDGIIDVDYYINYLVERSKIASSALVNNNITEEYVRFIKNMPDEYYRAIAMYYNIDIKNNLYTDINIDHYGDQNMSLSAIEYLYTSILKNTELKDYASYVSALDDSFSQLPNNTDFILSQYDIISDEKTSHIPTKANEIMLVVDKNETITDLLLGKLGYYSQSEFFNICYKATEDERYDQSLDKSQFKFEELLGKKFTYYPNNTIYQFNNTTTSSISPFTYSAYEGDWDDGIELTITCIVRPKEDLNYTSLSTGMYYTEALTNQILKDAKNSKIVNYLKNNNQESYSSGSFKGVEAGITYKLSYFFEGNLYENVTGFVGSTSAYSSLLSSFTGGSAVEAYTLSLRDLGGCDLPNQIKIYPIDFDNKYLVTDYLNTWNSDSDITVNNKIITAESRENITYSDNLELIIGVVNNLIQIVTTALVSFTALSLVVSTVMIAIITYVSVIERVKEIGVIRSLGGRKKDVSRLFNAEAFIIGTISGLIGVGVTYLLSGLINLIVGSITGIYTIASLPVPTAIIMVLISIVLTSISGLVPARLAAKKDPVVALRTE